MLQLTRVAVKFNDDGYDALMDRRLASALKDDINDFFLMLGAKYGFEVKSRCVEL